MPQTRKVLKRAHTSETLISPNLCGALVGGDYEFIRREWEVGILEPAACRGEVVWAGEVAVRCWDYVGIAAGCEGVRVATVATAWSGCDVEA